MSKLLKWIVNSLEIFEWEHDYCQCDGDDEFYSDEFSDTDDFDLYTQDDEMKEEHDEAPETITWQVEVEYSIGTVQKTHGTHVYLPENVEELYWGLDEFFLPSTDDDEEWKEVMD